MADPD